MKVKGGKKMTKDNEEIKSICFSYEFATKEEKLMLDNLKDIMNHFISQHPNYKDWDGAITISVIKGKAKATLHTHLGVYPAPPLKAARGY